MLQELTKLTPALARYVVQESPDREIHSEEALATWWQQKTPGTTYWRCHVPARNLPGNSFALKFSDMKIGPDGEVYVPRNVGTSVWQFVGNATRALIMAHLQEQGVQALMEVDDNYLIPPPTSGEWATKIDRSSRDRYSFQAHRKIIRWVDGIIVSTEHLAERYARHTSRPIYHCPNSVDLDDWPEVSPWFQEERVVGFAGSASHRYDLALVQRALDWAYRQPQVTLYRLGSVPWSIPHESLPWTDDLTQYRHNLQVLDVGLCPLKRSDWHDAKSDIKAIEYTLAGAVPIVQKAPPYADWYDLVPCAESEKDWLKAVKWAVNAPAKELHEVWKRAHDFVLEHKLIEQHIGKWREAVGASGS